GGRWRCCYFSLGHLKFANAGFVSFAHQFAAMICQLVPSLRSSAHFPAVAARIAVPAAPPASGMTLEVADTTVCAAMVLSFRMRPGLSDADGRVSVHVPDALKIIAASMAVAESVVPVTVLGALALSARVTVLP